ncbi:MAG: hypothetical protein JST96_17150, partial [Bacteroidetes bacterium]|nr:hypothetical protein [Bacteroidota bacterium]
GQPHRFRLNATKIVTLFLFAILAVFATQLKMQKHDKVLNFEIIDKNQVTDKKHFVNANSAEITKVIFQPLRLPLPDDIKAEKINPEKKKAPEPKIVDDGVNENNTDAILASYNEDNGAGEKEDEDATITNTADFQPDNNYSVAATSYVLAAPAQAPKPEVAKDFPFVPKSSFDFKVTQDTSAPDQYRIELDEKLAEASMTKALAALDKIDWNKLKKDISKANKEVDIQKLQDEIRKSITELDWQKINEENPSVITRDDLQKINRDIKIQLQSLQNSQVKNTAQARVFRKKLMTEQLKLERESLLKQQQLLKKVEITQKHKKIVYI